MPDHHRYFISVIRAKRHFDVRKKRTKLPELGGGVGEASLIRAMPESKRLFSTDPFPKSTFIYSVNLVHLAMVA